MTVLQESEVGAWARRLAGFHRDDAPRLDLIFNYLHDPEPDPLILAPGYVNGPLRWLRAGVPADVKRLAVMSRVNMVKFVVNAATQVMYVDGYRAPKEDQEQPVWETWQQNRLDARQIGIHRSALAYGVSYVVVLPGDPVPVIRGASPRNMTCVYGDDEDWPELALERRQSAKKGFDLYRLYDANNTWWIQAAKTVSGLDGDAASTSILKVEEHGVGHVPIVRFVATQDLDGKVEGEVEPMIPLQDQINVTTFSLLVAQHYGAFRQRYIMGWTASDESEALSASAKKLWTFEDDQVKVGEFSQTDLSGYINSREASLRHVATVSQTPAHELLGQLVNLSADALAAAEATFTRKIQERESSFGEAWEQVMELAAKIEGDEPNVMSEVRWRDTEARSLSQVADALGKLVLSLGVPPQELWEKIPGVSQSEVDRWKAAASQADAIAQLNLTLEKQANPRTAGLTDMTGEGLHAPNPQPAP